MRIRNPKRVLALFLVPLTLLVLAIVALAAYLIGDGSTGLTRQAIRNTENARQQTSNR